MLGAVLTHLTDTDADLWRPHPSGVIVASASHVRGAWVPSGMPFITSRAWVTTNVAEAYELLQARDLVPMGYVGRFVCEACGGRGSTSVETPEGYGYAPRCLDCVGAGHRPHPPTVAALASWASLGFAAGDDAPDDEISGLGMRLLALYPEKRYVLGRLLNDARVAVAETLRFVGIEEGGR
jgi:hypothetical protein